MSTGTFGERLGHLFKVRNPPTLVSCGTTSNVSAVTLIQNDDVSFSFCQHLTQEEAYLVILHLDRIACFDVSISGLSGSSEPTEAETVRIVDLASQNLVRVNGLFKLLVFYIPKMLLKDMAAQHGHNGFRTLECPYGKSFTDSIVLGLGRCLLPALQNFSRLQQPFVDYVLMSLRSHLVNRFTSITEICVPIRGLTTWQERRAKDLMAAHLQEGVSLEEVALACELSPSGFARGFKRNTGLTPYQWFLSLRVNQAMELMKTSDSPLVDIALQSGFADQSHFTRVFKEKVGTSPGAWRNGQDQARLTA